jgi:hypothetical protein
MIEFWLGIWRGEVYGASITHRIRRSNLSAFMRQLLTANTVFFNRRHRRVGYLLQGRLQARIVEGDDYQLKLSRYVHLNPVSGRRWQGQAAEARRKFLRDYQWGTYRSYAGEEQRWRWIEYAWPNLATRIDRRLENVVKC